MYLRFVPATEPETRHLKMDGVWYRLVPEDSEEAGAVLIGFDSRQEAAFIIGGTVLTGKENGVTPDALGETILARHGY